ncbi:DUF6262 family protein [Iningainema tapete]|uniref:Transposase n=1 Tax=Iningainema tapete BLCC-T55 TaxID=2748662 RepID=A0A8J7BZR4_9CYAN|nr:DUF6262 family protein [Iningainema tapete]MBD2778247.1 hypothetical protein [Iningainema tapete BLCC-T55]
MLKRNTSGLEAHAQQKRESALERVGEAITKLIQENKPVNFKTVSEESGVSRTWLYKELEIKEKINQIKTQQISKERRQKNDENTLNNKRIDSEQINELKTQIKKLETENYALRNHLEVVYGMAAPQLAEKVKILQQENEVLKERIKGNDNKVEQELSERIQSLESENQKLKQANQQIEQLQIDLNLARAKLDEYQQSKDSSKPNLIVLEHKKEELISSDSMLDTIKPRIKALGVRLNKKINELIESLQKEQVQNAVSAVEEYLATGKKITSKAGLLRKALEEAWTPNLTDSERVISQTKDTFSEWYKLAKEEGIVQASQGTKKGIIVLEPTGEWTPFEAMLEKGWTLEYLLESTRR